MSKFTIEKPKVIVLDGDKGERAAINSCEYTKQMQVIICGWH